MKVINRVNIDLGASQVKVFKQALPQLVISSKSNVQIPP